MQNVKNLKKSLSMFLAMLMVFCMTSIQVFAKDNLAMLTLDATNFTIVGEKGQTYTIEAKGLSSSYAPVEIEGDKVTWTSNNEKVAKIKSGQNSKNVVVELTGKGEAAITASYADDGVTPVSSNIVVEGEAEGKKTVTVTINKPNEKEPNIIKKIIIDVFDLKKEEYLGENFDDKDVLKKNPSALHALVEALKTEGKLEGLDIKSEGSFVSSILGIEMKYNPNTFKSEGWQYKVNDELVKKAASIYQLKAGDKIEWFYGPVISN